MNMGQAGSVSSTSQALSVLQILLTSSRNRKRPCKPHPPACPNPPTKEPREATPGLVSGGGSSSSRSWESLTSSIQRRSRSRRAGSGAEPRAETESQEQPDSTSSCRPGGAGRSPETGARRGPSQVCSLPSPHPTSPRGTTLQSVQKPHELLLGDTCPAEVQGSRLAANHTTKHGRGQ